ncbi:HAMP domain-containing protein [Paenibacillus uliginis N3/975]|uniref:histidine kinase n=1 Tax=Paenibacillus uliginis N3/975 TaxID=1313296 RepID=A0A1X7GGN6_9BACL|nr:HAMP domain-containing sensor histidine kinase [Paenibacillus uliginis]SMF69533.1 HAMP domain-containing protein [Paenibacillus uliginis N3/975]
MRRKSKLFGMLLRNYIFFSLTVGVSVLLLLLFFVERTNEWLSAQELSRLQASEIIRPNTADMPTEAIESFQGWVEILDERLRVIEVKGSKLDKPTSYTEKELNALFYDVKEKLYYTSIAPFHTDDGQLQYALIKLPKTNIKLEIALDEGTADNQKFFWKALMETGLLFIVLFGINVYVYSRLTAVRITNPLSAIATGIRNVAGGRYYERLHFEANYELAQIQESFNAMAEKLDKAEAEKKLLEESKQRMLVHISHDLKTPITTIQGYAKALQLGMIEDEEKKQRTVKLIHDKTELVTELIDDVFELSKLESPDYPIVKEACDLAEFVREMAVDYYDLFEEKHFVFECDIPSQEVFVPFNGKLMYRAVSNLLENALKYNPPGTNVQLTLVNRDTEVRIEVTDNGVGIPDHLRDRVFDAFSRGDVARKSDGGTGLGLTIARHIVEKHRGWLVLDTDGGTTRFELTLPKNAVAATKLASAAN